MAKKILIVDDEEVILHVASEFIKIFGYDCITADSSESAMKAVAEQQPDLVILDMYLPGTTGEKILESIKASYPQMKILLSTGRQLDDDEAARVIKKGALGVMHKPFGLREFKEKLAELLA